MEAISLTVQNLWPMLNFFVDKLKNRQTDSKTDRAKATCP